MADLDVQPKRKRAWWPWILLIIIVLAAAFFFTRTNEPDRPTTLDAEPTGTTATAAPIINFKTNDSYPFI